MMTDFRDRVDRLLNHCTKTFGEDVILLPKRGGRYEIRGIFDNEHVGIDPDTEQVISTQQPILGINLHKISIRPRSGDVVKIRNLNYRVIEIREDGQGGASLILHKEDHAQRVRKKPY